MNNAFFKKRINASSGQISRVLIVLGIVVIVVAVIVFLAIRITASKKSQASKTTTTVTNNEPPKPVYEVTLGDIQFDLVSSIDMGSVVKSSMSYQQNLTTTERFIKVTVSAQNKGKNNTDQFSWNLGNIIDSEGRNFLVDNQAYYFLPKPDLCGAILKPEFQPTPCVKLYEVSKKSKGLKLEVITKSPKLQKALLDLKIY